MKSITIHKLDSRLSEKIHQEAQKRELSLNQTIKSLLAEILGVKEKLNRPNFAQFAGTWSQEESREFEKNLKEFEIVDSQDWQ